MSKIISIVLLAVLAGCVNQGGGLTNPPIGLGAEEPSLTVTDHGLVLSWLEPFEGDILLNMAIHQGVKWSPVKTIAKGENWFVNWADFPAIVSNGNMLFTHFLQKSDDATFAYDVMYTVSPDMGETWNTPQKLHQDTVKGEHGFVSAIAYKDGFQVSWLDGRFTGEENGAMTIRGAYVDGEGEVHDAAEIDHKTCDCCQTSMTLVNGTPWSFYRDRTDEEIRDIYFSKLIDNKWSEPEALNNDNWLIKGCPVNGPVAGSINSNVAVAWFTGAEGAYKVKLKISTDAGNTFTDEILVDGPKAIGRVDVQLDSAKIYVTFLTKADDEAALKLKVYDYAGELKGSETLAVVSSARGTGFPRTAIWHENLIIVWTDIEQHSIKLLQYPLNKKRIGAHAGLPASP